MTYDQLISVIYGSSKSDWLLSDERGIYTHKSNLNIRIERKEIDQDFDKFSRKGWTTSHADPVAYRVIYGLFYGASLIKEFLVVAVDGHRATLPLPDRKTLKVSKEGYGFAQIVDLPISMEHQCV
jgi:hypothetical protein